MHITRWQIWWLYMVFYFCAQRIRQNFDSRERERENIMRLYYHNITILKVNNVKKKKKKSLPWAWKSVLVFGISSRDKIIWTQDPLTSLLEISTILHGHYELIRTGSGVVRQWEWNIGHNDWSYMAEWLRTSVSVQRWTFISGSNHKQQQQQTETSQINIYVHLPVH